jgi:hypothetical protein
MAVGLRSTVEVEITIIVQNYQQNLAQANKIYIELAGNYYKLPGLTISN